MSARLSFETRTLLPRRSACTISIPWRYPRPETVSEI
jgi:hypothetical protein